MVIYVGMDESIDLKYFVRKGNQVSLEAANSNYEPILINLDDVSIQGKRLAVWRKI